MALVLWLDKISEIYPKCYLDKANLFKLNRLPGKSASG